MYNLRNWERLVGLWTWAATRPKFITCPRLSTSVVVVHARVFYSASATKIRAGRGHRFCSYANRNSSGANICAFDSFGRILDALAAFSAFELLIGRWVEELGTRACTPSILRLGGRRILSRSYIYVDLLHLSGSRYATSGSVSDIGRDAMRYLSGR